MKKIKALYGLLFVAALFVVVVIIASIKAPPPDANNKTAEASNCVPSLLTGQTLVNGLGKDVQIPLFPGAKRLTFTDVTAVEYSAKAYDSDIKNFYNDRMSSLCWQVKEQRQNQIVYKNDTHELKLSLLPNPSGRTVIDYVVTTTKGVLGIIRIAQAACTTGQYYCNGGCVASGAACPAPTDASACSGGAIYCPSPSGTGGWCQMPPCPSSTTTSSSTCGSGQWWCNGSCISMTTACNGYYPNGTTSSSGTTSGSSTACTGTYQQSGVSYPQCNNSVCPNGCTWDSSGCPNGCYTSSSSGTTSSSCPSGQYWCNGACINNTSSCQSNTGNTGAWPTDQATCTSQAKFWCTSSSSSGWCQSTTCSTASVSGCPAGQFWCSSSNTCIPSSSSCAPVSSGSNTAPNGQKEQIWNANGLRSWIRTDADPARIEQLKQTCARVSSGANIWMPNAGTQSSVDFGMPNPDKCRLASACAANQYFDGATCSNSTSGGYNSTCPSGQYMCSGTCINSGSSCSQAAWPMDQASCTNQNKFWCTGSGGGGGGWCQSTACSTNYTTATCAAGQWLCNNACISTTASCNGYNYNGTSVTPPSGTTCAGGYTWCASSQSCVNAVQPCVPAASQTTPQTQQTQPQNSDQARTNQQPNNQQFNQNSQQFNQGPSEADMKRQDEQEKRMREQQFQQMKRGLDQFARGVAQMKRFVDQAKTRLAKQGVGLPLDLTNALAKAPELLTKLKAAKTQEEFEDLMGDMQDIGMIMQEWGPKMGELQRLGGMLSQLDKDVRNMSTNFKRIKIAAARRPELADALKEVEAMLGVMGKKAADAKTLAKSDPEGALELVDDFYANSEEYWNTAAVVDMVANITRGLAQASSEIRRAETRIRAIERGKQADAETIATLKDMLAAIKATLPELKAVVAKRPLDYEEVKLAAEDFWAQIQEFENLLAEQGQSFYAPTVKNGESLRLDIPEGFLGAPNNSGPPGTGSFEGGGPGGFGPGGL